MFFQEYLRLLNTSILLSSISDHLENIDNSSFWKMKILLKNMYSISFFKKEIEREIMIEFRNVKKVYTAKNGSVTTALNNVNLKMSDTGMVFLVGKSGSGKSTFLNLLGGLDQLTSGEILVHGKNIGSFNKEQYDSYRNTSIGFVFQEFNLLESYNVYENIELVSKLQNRSVERREIDKILEQLGIHGLGNRKMNELSGGQKQRVAIARALIKGSQILLADEPTGNLDRASSEQIFTILKEISQKQLVLVVSHDMESAERYGNRIIEIEDGMVISDSNPVLSIKNKPFFLKKAKLPLFYILKMIMKSFKTKPMKLFMTLFLTAISLVFMGFTINSLLFDRTMLVVNTMRDNDNYIYDVQKTKFDLDGAQNNYVLEEEDLFKIEKIVNAKINPMYTLYDNGESLNFTFGNLEEKGDYYKNLWQFSFVEIKDPKILGKLIGREPQKENEIVVHKYFADYVMKTGIMTTNGELYFPKSYEEFVSAKEKLKLGVNEVVLVGIIDDDNHLFEQAKKEGYFVSDALESYFSQNYVLKASYIYVKGFTEYVHLRSEKEAVLNYTFIETNYSGHRSETIENTIKDLRQNISCITTSGVTTKSFLNKNEIILSLDDLKKIDKNFDSKFNAYLKTKGNVIYEEALKQYIPLYLNEQSTNLVLLLNLYIPNEEKESIRDVDVTIMGITLEKNSYISHQYVEEYSPVMKRIYAVRIFDKNVRNLSRALKNLKYREFNPPDLGQTGIFYNYTVSIDTQNSLTQVMSIYHYLYIYILIISLVFVLFTFLLFSNFIALSISYCKKEIGILRALGTRNIDVIKIFGYESLGIAIVSWILSMFGWIVLCHLLNQSLFGTMYYTLHGIVLHPFVPIFLFIYTIGIALFITIVSIKRITRIKPIEAILNK